MSTITGPLVVAGALERAIAAHLTTPDPETGGTWINDGLRLAERAHGLEPGILELPHGVVSRSDFAKWPEDQLPVILVIAAGLAEPPTRRADGKYEARWLVGLAPVVADVDVETTHEVALVYGAAVRWAMLVKPSLGGFAEDTIWRDEQYGDVPNLASRSIGSARSVFEVVVPDVVQRAPGQARPTADGADPGDWPDSGPGVLDGIDLVPITESVHA